MSDEEVIEVTVDINELKKLKVRKLRYVHSISTLNHTDTDTCLSISHTSISNTHPCSFDPAPQHLYITYAYLHIILCYTLCINWCFR